MSEIDIRRVISDRSDHLRQAVQAIEVHAHGASRPVLPADYRDEAGEWHPRPHPSDDTALADQRLGTAPLLFEERGTDKLLWLYDSSETRYDAAGQ